ncbi:MAG: insulinase family protein [Phycisphaerales bacterium]|nr:insulinase family protein [Phycisphaerales bacterium]
MRCAVTAALFTLLLIAGPARAQQVAYEKYSLPNGMTVILHEDHSLPVATINIWYRVGAQDEPPGRSGFAHLFEHLMFMGTQRVPGNQFDVLMESGGGANNASTDLHRTNYFSWGPSKLLPTLLWLDADRLEDMGQNMSQEKLDKQRDVVRNELRQTVENAPYGKAGEMVFKLLYEPTHPYYYGVIGTHQDLEAANVANVKDFFATFYVPSNASLVIAGDFDPGLIKPMVAELFGDLPAGQPVARKYARPAAPIPVKLESIRRFTSIDKVSQPRVEFSYHSPVAFGDGDAEMQLASDVLAGGKSSRLYRRLVIDEKLAAEVSASQQGYPLDGIFQVAAYTRPDADLDKVERIMDEELARFVKDGPTSEELERHKASIELATLTSLQRIERKADMLNEYEYYWGEPDGFKRDLERFRAATPAGVREWSARTLRPDSRVIIRVLPEKPQRAASARDTRPADADPGLFTLPLAQSFTADNGLKVHVWTRPELPLVAMRLISRPGGALDKPGQPGLASLAAEMLGEGAGDLDALAFEDAVQTIGGTFNSGADHETISLSMTILKRNLDKGAGLFADAVRRPRFDAKEWERVKSLRIEGLKQQLEVPGAISATVGNRLLFGDDHPYAWPVDGTPSSVVGFTLEAARDAYGELLTPATSTLLIAGDITAEEARQLVDRTLGGWSGGAARAAGKAEWKAVKHDSLLVAVVDRPGATQTMIGFRAPGVKYADRSRVDRELLNTLLGGSFTSRLNQNLREDKGYTYGARSGYAMDISVGTFTAGASVKADTTGASLKEFMKEFDRLRGGDVSEQEAVKASETLRNSTVRGFQGLSGMLGAAAELVTSDLPFDTVSRDMEAMSKATASDLNTLARTALPIDRGVLVLVGDKAVILEQIKDLGLPQPVEYDAEGNPKR